MNNKSLVELKKLVNKDIEYCQDILKTFEGNENPQVKEIYNNNNIRLEAMKDILMYITEGSRYQFNKLEV